MGEDRCNSDAAGRVCRRNVGDRTATSRHTNARTLRDCHLKESVGISVRLSISVTRHRYTATKCDEVNRGCPSQPHCFQASAAIEKIRMENIRAIGNFCL